MEEKEAGGKVGLIVKDFLPIGQVWIWRQLSLEKLAPVIIFARARSNEKLYPANHVIVFNQSSNFLLKVRMKLWFIFKYFYHGLNKSEKKMIKSGLSQNHISVVHAHFGTVGSEILDLCKELNMPLLVTFHGFDATSVPRRWPGYADKLHKLFQYADTIIAVSNFIREKLINLGCPPDKIALCYLGVPIPKTVKAYSIPGSRIRFIHIGSFVEKKGVPDLVKAFARAFPSDANVELMLVGDGYSKELCRELILELKPANPILMKGTVLSDQVYKEFLEADVFVLNSRIDSQGTTEGLPIALLEAQSYGLPVISTIHAGIPEAIVHNHTGLLISEKDQDALIGAMRQLNNADLIKRMGMQAHAFVKEKFNLIDCNKQLEELYRKADNNQMAKLTYFSN